MSDSSRAAVGAGDAIHAETGATRRQFLIGAAASAAAVWLPAFRVTPADAAQAAEEACSTPPAFPAGIELYKQAWENWSREIVIDALWTCVARSAQDVVALANWAGANGYQIRARGCGHGWSPLTVTADSGCGTNVVLVDTRQFLNGMEVVAPAPGVTALRAGAGATLDALLAFLEQNNLGLATHPATGDITLGGLLAINGHGACLPAQGEVRPRGYTYGSLSNLILAITAVVWDEGAQQYVSRTIPRTHPDIAALLVHLGRTFITEVVLQVGPLQNIRCRSFTNVNADELFGPEGSSTRTFASYVERSGRAEAIWFPFTQYPWMKVWSVAPIKPPLSRPVSEPYNYSFSDNIPVEVSDLATAMVSGQPEGALLFGEAMLAAARAGLVATATTDIWGPSKNTQLYIRATTLRARETGYPILTRRASIQRVIHEFKEYYVALVEQYRARGLYPMNMPVEIRCSGLDHGADVLLPHARPPLLSSLLPRADRPEWDVAIWINLLCLVGTPGADEFYSEIQDWFIRHYAGGYATVRPEWSKGWAHTPAGAYTHTDMLQHTIPDWFRAGRTGAQTWDAAIAKLDRLDPQRVFSNAFLDRFAV